MRKIVIKAVLKDRDAAEMKLEALAPALGMPVWIHDRVFLPRGLSGGSGEQKNYLKMILRTEMWALDRPAVHFLIMRRRIADNDVDFENVSQVHNYAEVLMMIMQLGFEMKGQVMKMRQKTELNKIGILFDKFQDKDFIKIERKLDKGEDMAMIRGQMIELMMQIGIKPEDILEKPYFEIS